MGRAYNPQAKTHDPAWIAAYNRQNRHKPAAQVAFRIPYDLHDRWQTAARQAHLTLKEWIVQQCERSQSFPELTHE